MGERRTRYSFRPTFGIARLVFNNHVVARVNRSRLIALRSDPKLIRGIDDLPSGFIQVHKACARPHGNRIKNITNVGKVIDEERPWKKLPGSGYKVEGK
jgi:hypothetical protein